jgi:hypothetical protein
MQYRLLLLFRRLWVLLEMAYYTLINVFIQDSALLDSWDISLVHRSSGQLAIAKVTFAGRKHPHFPHMFVIFILCSQVLHISKRAC